MTTTYRVLIIDDDAVFASMLSRSLTRHQIASDIAPNSEQALALIKTTRFDSVLLDINLGKQQSGLPLIEPLLVQQADINIIIITGYASIATAVDAIKRGAQNYLCKPIHIEDVLKALRIATDNQSINTALTPLNAWNGNIFKKSYKKTTVTYQPLRVCYTCIAALYKENYKRNLLNNNTQVVL
jgi:two-component system, response regulator RegA